MSRGLEVGKGVIKEQKWANKFGCDQFTLEWQLALGASEPLKAVSAWFPRCFHGLLLSMARTCLAVWGQGGLCLLAPPALGCPTAGTVSAAPGPSWQARRERDEGMW